MDIVRKNSIKNWPAEIRAIDEKVIKALKASTNSVKVITVNSTSEVPYQSQRFRGVLYKPLQNAQAQKVMRMKKGS